jgi:hypothetical protein
MARQSDCMLQLDEAYSNLIANRNWNLTGYQLTSTTARQLMAVVGQMQPFCRRSSDVRFTPDSVVKHQWEDAIAGFRRDLAFSLRLVLPPEQDFFLFSLFSRRRLWQNSCEMAWLYRSIGQVYASSEQ